MIYIVGYCHITIICLKRVYFCHHNTVMLVYCMHRLLVIIFVPEYMCIQLFYCFLRVYVNNKAFHMGKTSIWTASIVIFLLLDILIPGIWEHPQKLPLTSSEDSSRFQGLDVYKRQQ